MIEGESFKMNILLTATGTYIPFPPSHDVHKLRLKFSSFFLGTKFVLLTSLIEPTAETVLQKVYEVYADAVMKNPFHTPEMPIRTEGFDTRITALLGSQ